MSHKVGLRSGYTTVIVLNTGIFGRFTVTGGALPGREGCPLRLEFRGARDIRPWSSSSDRFQTPTRPTYALVFSPLT